MKNELVFKSLNNETKEYLSVVYSIMDYLNNCNPSIPVTNSDGETIYVAITDGNYINGLAFFLAGLYVDGPTKEFFNSRDITFENCFSYINSDNNTEFKLIGDDLFNNEAFGLINLGSYLGTISTQIKDDYYLADKDFSINDIEGYQIFDYSMIFYTDIVEDLMYEMFGIDDFFKSELFDDYQTTREGIYANMAKERYDVDIFKTRDEIIWEFDFERFKLIHDNGYTYLFTPDKSDVKVKVLGEDDDTIDINNFEILRINGKSIDFEYFNSILSLNDNDIIELTILDDEDNERIFATKKGELFEKVEDKKENRKTTNLDKYGEDLTKLNYLSDPSVGRDDDIRRIEQVLLYPERDKSIIITGESGVGKTALVRGLAYRIKNGNVPSKLKDLRIYSIDNATMVAGTKYVGMLEEKMKNILDEASGDKDIILFIDEIHQIISGGATENSNNSVAEILKPYLDVGKVRVIGATTTEDYMETVSSNPAFKTRFKRIDIKEPTNDTMYTILDNLIDTYNEVSGIVLDPDYTNRANIIKSLLDVTKKSCRDYKDPANNPRLVIDILKEAYAIAAINDRDEVTMDDIKLAISDEERIYKSARDRYSTIYGRETQKPKGIVLEFKPKKY